MTIFPLLQPQLTEGKQLPLCRDVLWDAAKGAPVFRAGAPVFVQGAEAVASWAWRALRVCRYRHELYTWDYGSELETLVGQAYTPALKQAEARRYVEEAMAPNPYIKAVRQIQTEFDEQGLLRIRGTIDTIYGPVEIGGEGNGVFFG